MKWGLGTVLVRVSVMVPPFTLRTLTTIPLNTSGRTTSKPLTFIQVPEFGIKPIILFTLLPAILFPISYTIILFVRGSESTPALSSKVGSRLDTVSGKPFYIKAKLFPFIKPLIPGTTSFFAPKPVSTSFLPTLFSSFISFRAGLSFF